MGTLDVPSTSGGWERIAAEGQPALAAHGAALPVDASRRLLQDAARVDWASLARAVREGPPPLPPELRPPAGLTLRRQQAVGGLRPRLAAEGRRLLAEGRVATVLLAGGEGTRLGHGGPKGTFVLGPEPDRTLYAILAERVARVGREVGRPVPLRIVTSPTTDEATREAFAAPERYGLEAGQVRIVVQDTLPVLDAEGRALLAAPDRLLRAPDGHGGALAALGGDDVLDARRDGEARIVTTFQVDNPLARPLDPVMLGWLLERRLDAVGKAVRRTSPEERVGLYGRDLAGRLRILEYSEAGDHPAARELTLGSIAVHAFDADWLRGALMEGPRVLPLHAARKRVTAYDPATGAMREVEGRKLERFLFDVLPHAGRAEVQEVERAREFAPIKSSEGPDSPATARALVAAEVARWRAERGLPPVDAPSLRPLELDAGMAPTSGG